MMGGKFYPLQLKFENYYYFKDLMFEKKNQNFDDYLCN